MIRSCKYCLSQEHLCPRCEGPVLIRTITERIPGAFISTSLFICLTPECENYGHFKQESTNSIETIICPKCEIRIKKMKLFQEDLAKAFQGIK